MGNLHSVKNAFEAVGADVLVSGNASDLKSASRIVLPGVGAFDDCIGTLSTSGLIDALGEEVQTAGKPFLGICLGMQVLGRSSDESLGQDGLAWLPFDVRRLEDAAAAGLKVPHVGWNDVRPVADSPLFSSLGESPTFYFVHSFHPVPDDPDLTVAETEYGSAFSAAIAKDNIFATQFHPEKSQHNGLTLLANFLTWDP